MPETTTAAARCEVVTLGECLVALVAMDVGPLAEVGVFGRHVAGAEANVAVGLARLGHRVAFVGRVGADGLGTAILRGLRGAGVVVDWLRVDADAPTGLVIRERRALGPADVLYRRTSSAGSPPRPRGRRCGRTGRGL
jgi:2-dehydro-3-deoxygluconokinase